MVSTSRYTYILRNGHPIFFPLQGYAYSGDMARAPSVWLSPWLDGAYKGRSTVRGEECVQYGISLEETKAMKMMAKELTRRYEDQFGCKLSVRGRKNCYWYRPDA